MQQCCRGVIISVLAPSLVAQQQGCEQGSSRSLLCQPAPWCVVCSACRLASAALAFHQHNAYYGILRRTDSRLR